MLERDAKDGLGSEQFTNLLQIVIDKLSALKEEQFAGLMQDSLEDEITRKHLK